MDKHVEPASSASASWSVYDPLTKAQNLEFQKAGIEHLQAQLLYNRGIKTPEAMRRFLDARYDQLPDPLTLIDMDRAPERIQRALEPNEHMPAYAAFDAARHPPQARLSRAIRP